MILSKSFKNSIKIQENGTEGPWKDIFKKIMIIILYILYLKTISDNNPVGPWKKKINKNPL